MLHEKDLKLPGLQEISRAIETADQQAAKIEKFTVSTVEKKLARGRRKTVRPRFSTSQDQLPCDGHRSTPVALRLQEVLHSLESIEDVPGNRPLHKESWTGP